MHNGVVAESTVKTKTIRAGGHPAVLRTIEVVSDQGVLPAGLMVAENIDGKGVPFVDLTKVIGTGTGSLSEFSGVIDGFPIQPGSVEITDGVETFSDDGLGNLVGDGGGAGSVVHATGAVSITFAANVVDTIDVTATATNRFRCVLDRDIDTTKSIAGQCIIHGSVKKDELLMGATFADTPDDNDFLIYRGELRWLLFVFYKNLRNPCNPCQKDFLLWLVQVMYVNFGIFTTRRTKQS